MDNAEDEANNSGRSAESLTAPHQEAIEEESFLCNQKATTMRPEWHKKDTRRSGSSTAIQGRQINRALGIRPRSDSAHNLIGMSYGQTGRTKTSDHSARARANVSVPGNVSHIQWPESAFSFDQISVPSYGKINERRSRELLHDKKESFRLRTDNSTRVKEYQRVHQSDRQTREDGRRKGNRFSENLKASVSEKTRSSKDDMDYISSRKAPSEDDDMSFMMKSNSEANWTAQERKKDNGLIRRRRGGGRGHRSGQMFDRVMTNDFAVDKKREESERNETLIHHGDRHQTAATGDRTSNHCYEASKAAARPSKNRGKTPKRTAEDRKATTKVDSEDVDENILTKINAKVRSLFEEDTSQMCRVLSKEKTLLKKIIKLSCKDEKLLINVIGLLEKALSSRFAQHSGLNLIIILKDTSFFESAIVPLLSTYLAVESLDWSQHLPVLNRIIKLALIFFSLTPTSMYLIFGLLDILQRIADNLPVTVNHETVLQEVKEGIVEIQSMKESQVSKRMTSVTHRVPRAFLHDNEQPPDNFREIEMYPQLEEIKADKPPFFRMNKETGWYNDLEHYLDVQYRLLREDFICPLREGIREYKQNIHMKKKELQDLRLYYDVKVQQLAPGRDGIYHQLQFNVSHLRHVEWAHSKRLLYGSFLCLSSNDFETMLFATVADRDPRDLRRGVMSVSFQTDFKDVMEKSHETFVMVESIAFFEAYKHVLFGLQNIYRLPFQKHLVNCEKDVDSPIYLSSIDSPVYDLQPLLDRTMIISKYQTNGQEALDSKAPRNVHVLSLSEWPSADDMGLDQSQYKAIQTALTRQFSITQGPPGTGKTYIGLQIVRVLLHNRHVWDENSNALFGTSRSPMLIVCYTNHALDQFLEGILKFFTGDIVRVGSRSSSKALEEHHLDKFREIFRRNGLVPRDITDTLFGARDFLNLCLMKLADKANFLKQAQQRLLTEAELYSYMEHLYDSLNFGFEEMLWNDIYMVAKVAQHGMKSWIIEEWLGCGYLLPINDENLALLRNMNYSDDYATIVGKDAEDIADRVSEDAYVNVVDVADALEADRLMRDDNDFFLDSRKEITQESVRTDSARPKTQFRSGEDANPTVETDVKENQNGVWQISKAERKRRNEDLKRQIHATSVMGQEQVDNVVNVWELDYKDRWRLYIHWRQLYLNALEEDFVRQANLCEEVMRVYKETKMREDEFVLQHAHIIGMTTTCAARYQSVLQKIGPRIIIVEEAAEVLESHIITTLSEHCQHLILIGDHEQLRPNPTTYTLAKDYKLDISLFERMVNNGIQCDCLEEQHRMRPEISMLLRHIYPNLRDHESVSEYEHIRGVGSDIFFIDHNQEELDDADQKSRLNEHEARYVAALCKYLLRQGYSPNQITVLTTYSGQLFCLRKMMPKSDFDGVKVTVVDNYQGEENDIILLSLVRSNREGKIGFLKISNRICVALSRAKKGFYVIGNFSFLTRHSELWKNIIETLKKEKRLENVLTLYCQNHPDDDGFKASDAHDFEIFSPEGGCKKECKARLKCGHVCNRLCHPDDRDHEKFRCKKPCEKLCERGHSCKKQCYQHCKCMVTVAKEMPECNHEQYIPCYLNPADFKCKFPVSRTLPICQHTVTVECGKNLFDLRCPMPCEKRLSCGHACQRLCGEMHTSCLEIVEKILERGHKLRRQWSKSESKIVCREKCTRPLICGHICQKICGEKHDHDQYCEQKVTKNVPCCGHTVQTMCNIRETKLKCQNMIEVTFNCGHTSRVRCGQESSQKCNVMIEKKFECGHKSDVLCHRAGIIHCQGKCNTRLVCGHQCSGDCTECCKDRLHTKCSVPNVEVLICGHVCTILCSYCPPCENKCDQKCSHKTCMKGCSEYCEPCIEPCTWSCPHFQCTKTCNEICDRPPCNEPCQELLKCGHSCIGICGEPCPSLCRICNKDKVRKRRFGTETNPKSKFVQLSDCGDVVEVTSMDRWMQKQIQHGDLAEIRFPICPCCKTTIRNNVRYQRELKTIREAIREVKSRLCSPDRTDQLVKDDLVSKIEMLESLFKMKSKMGLESQIGEAFMKSVDEFKKWISRQNYIVTPQHNLDIRDELKRLQLMLKLILLSHEDLKGDTQLTNDQRDVVESARAHTLLLSGERLGNNLLEVERCVENIARLSTSYFSDESLMISNTIMDVGKEWARGTWITCLAGHVVRKVELINGSCPSCVSGVRETVI
ncbi:hypothetical protein CHS0354_015165 [Potamilus streckersoni]|uniref:NF-X1-type domain-containing protein n=1 Tax=Potamilus streckersoni TaxID=2493646 RepID=A0AAE0SD27_9BIVA|nr:hypothetical protein CHS0354_015165 [Potamilus streckersoni]